MLINMCFYYLLRSHPGLFTDFLVSVYGISRSMVILFLGFSLLCMWHWRIRKIVKSVCMAGGTCVGTMAYAHKHLFSLSRDIFFLEPPLVGHRAYLRDPPGKATGLLFGIPPLVGHRAYLQDPLW